MSYCWKKVFSAITGFFFFQPLKVEVDPVLVERIDEILNSKSSEKDDVLRTVFNGARNYVQAEISNSLQEFRSKLCLGTKVKCQIDRNWFYMGYNLLCSWHRDNKLVFFLPLFFLRDFLLTCNLHSEISKKFFNANDIHDSVWYFITKMCVLTHIKLKFFTVQ